MCEPAPDPEPEVRAEGSGTNPPPLSASKFASGASWDYASLRRCPVAAVLAAEPQIAVHCVRYDLRL